MTEFISPDYSIVPSSDSLVAIIEIGIITETSSYYAVLRVANSWWVTNSILNVVMIPKIEIISVDQDQRVREKSGM